MEWDKKACNRNGKAAEHLVCFDLIRQGYNAFLADYGLPFDILIEKNGELKKIQVKSTTDFVNVGKTPLVYRMHVVATSWKNKKYNWYRKKAGSVDYFAFVVLPTKQIAYIPVSEMIASDGTFKITMDFKTNAIQYPNKNKKTGKGKDGFGRRIEDYADFK